MAIDIKKLKDILLILLGVMFLSVSINVFYSPNDIVVGGFSGIAIIVQHLTLQYTGYGIPLAVTNIVLNIPLFIVAYFIVGKEYLWKTAFATAIFSFALQIGTVLEYYVGDFTLVAVFGGILDGVGVGLVLRAMASTGGVDMLAVIVQRKFRHVGLAKILFVINGIIIIFGVFVFGIERAMYAIISIFISGKVINTVLEGFSFSKAAFIISENNDEIAKEILNRCGRGVTGLNGKGMYTRDEKNVLFCVFSQKEITLIKDIVRNKDANAFLIVTDIKEVMGEGFKSFEDTN